MKIKEYVNKHGDRAFNVYTLDEKCYLDDDFKSKWEDIDDDGQIGLILSLYNKGQSVSSLAKEFKRKPQEIRYTIAMQERCLLRYIKMKYWMQEDLPISWLDFDIISCIVLGNKIYTGEDQPYLSMGYFIDKINTVVGDMSITDILDILVDYAEINMNQEYKNTHTDQDFFGDIAKKYKTEKPISFLRFMRGLSNDSQTKLSTLAVLSCVSYRFMNEYLTDYERDSSISYVNDISTDVSLILQAKGIQQIFSNFMPGMEVAYKNEKQAVD